MTGRVLATTNDLVVAALVDDGYIGVTRDQDAVRFDATGKRRWATHLGGEFVSLGSEVAGNTVLAWVGSSAAILAADTGAKRATFESDAPINRVAFDARAQRIATVGGPTIQVWDLADGKLVSACATPALHSQAVRFTPDGTR